MRLNDTPQAKIEIYFNFSQSCLPPYGLIWAWKDIFGLFFIVTLRSGNAHLDTSRQYSVFFNTVQDRIRKFCYRFNPSVHCWKTVKCFGPTFKNYWQRTSHHVEMKEGGNFTPLAFVSREDRFIGTVRSWNYCPPLQVLIFLFFATELLTRSSASCPKFFLWSLSNSIVELIVDLGHLY